MTAVGPAVGYSAAGVVRFPVGRGHGVAVVYGHAEWPP